MPLLPNLLYDLIEARANVFGRLAAFAAVAPDVPIRVEAPLVAQIADLRGCEAFVVAIVPFRD
jgi:hypothetical protein